VNVRPAPHPDRLAASPSRPPPPPACAPPTGNPPAARHQPVTAEKPFLNTLRWTSAFVVLFGHAVAWSFAINENGRQSAIALTGLKYLLDLGGGAVIVFFVISGYLVGGGVIRAGDAFRWRHYAISRFSRIYIVIVPALLLTAGLDGIAHVLAPTAPIYAAPWARLHEAVFSSYGWREVIASLLSLESIIGRPMGSDKPLWSLGLEWFFYFLFPAALVAARKLTGSLHWQLLLCAALAIGLAALGQRWLAVFWLIWLAGAAASRVAAPRMVALAGGLIGLGAFLATPFADPRIVDPAEGLGMALLLAWPPVMNARLGLTLDRRLADISYSLYVVHMPVLTFVVFCLWRAGATPLARLPFGAAGLACWLGICLAALMVASLFSVVFERRTDALKRRLLRLSAPGLAASNA
jgi:peptidoglycan/LPS O-acetylase OafA/YrhL